MSANPKSIQQATRAWLARLCELQGGASRGVVLLDDGTALTPGAIWPDSCPGAPELVAAAQVAHQQQRPVLAAKRAEGEAAAGGYVALPFRLGSGLAGVAALEIVGGDPRAALEAIRRELHWLQALEQGQHARERLVTALDLVGVALEHESAHDNAAAVATELATRLGLSRVSIGALVRGRNIVEAVSNSGRFDTRARLIRDLGSVMDEACDQDATVCLPVPERATPRIVRAHEAFSREHGAESLCSVPLAAFERVVGAIVFEAAPGAALVGERVRMLEDVSALLGPLLWLRRRGERGLVERMRERARELRARLFGPGHLELKLGTAAAVAVAGILLAVPGGYRIGADALLEGRVRRVIVAGIDGYIGEANARAGDLVQRGQVLGRLDERDLLLERRKWEGQREQLVDEHREALAAHDRAKLNIQSARIAQADAQIALLHEQLTRTQLVAPFDGIVVRGDLSQALGSPVGKGDVLFEVTPLEGYRIILQIDERDVRDVAAGQQGKLVLSALPGRSLPLTVERVTPVATAEDGRNFFRAEARLDEPVPSLQPGMAGVAKIEAGRRPLIWIWTHDLQDWLRLLLWSWLP